MMNQNKIVKYQAGQLQRLSNVLSITNKILDIDLRKLFIIHLDDHSLFRKGVKISLLKKLPNIQIKEFSRNDGALEFIASSYKDNKKIDLIITDFNHPGPNGLIFAKEVRELEKKFNVKTPIMLFTMRWEDSSLIEATKAGIFDGYFPKSAELDGIISFIKK
ncbi:response regulator [Chitinophagaceae bacterium 26-R-25]|nr:response regulator [Chitinophagaceae bacterium 26-R-25]